jgi:hypothetical protein
MSVVLDDLFVHQTSETEGYVDPYSDLLAKVADSCPDANLALESQLYSKLSAIQQGNCTIYGREAFAGEDLPFDPSAVAVQITYDWDRQAEQWDLAWVATWPYED